MNEDTHTCHLAESNLLVGLSCWLSGKEPSCRHRRPTFKPWVGQIPWRKEMATRSSILAWEIPWTEVWHACGCKESRHNSVTKQQQLVDKAEQKSRTLKCEQLNCQFQLSGKSQSLKVLTHKQFCIQMILILEKESYHMKLL